MKLTNKLIIIIIAAVICTADIFNNGNEFLQLILALAGTFVIFSLPHLPYKIKGLPYGLLLVANISVFILTFTHKVFLVNILLLSFLIWKAITPFLLRFKTLLPVATILAFISVYIAAFVKISIPLFPVVFYPIYLLGAIVYKKNIIKTRKIWLFGFFNLSVAAVALAVFMFKSLGQSVIGSLLFLNIEKPGTVTAVYLPFLALFLVWFAGSANVLLYMLLSKFEKGNAIFDLSTHFKPVFNLISFFAVATLATFICEFSIRQSVKSTMADILDPNIVFNILFLAGIYLGLISIIGKGLANIIIGIVTLFLTIANFIKFTYFNEPFYPWDIYMVKNMFGIAKDYLSISLIVISVLGLSAAVFLLIRFRRNIGRYLRPRIYLTLIPFAVIIILMNVNVLKTFALSSQIGIEKSWYIGKTEILSNGMFAQNYYYLTDLDKYLNPKPDGYDEEAINAIAEKYQSANNQSVEASTVNPDVKPNVIAIMSESYWDLTKLNGIEFSKDIAENVHKYQNGRLAPPAIGGGTANTEFEALTGMSLYFMSPGIIAYNAYLRTETPSIASVFKDNGYSTTAIHPNSGWFYNRDKVYNYFGFDTFYDVSSFDMETQTKGPHISDYAMVDKIIDTLNSSDKPAFIFAVSMENHDPFTDKFENFDVTVESDKLDESQKNIVSGLAQGLYDADQALGKLIDALSKSNKPTLLYFFGDHAPRLGSLDDYYKVYDKLGADDIAEQTQGIGILKYYTTPYVSWSNYRDMRKIGSIISPSHLAYEIMSDAGVTYPSYFNILPELESKYPIMHLQNMGLVNPDNELVKDYRMIQYDLLFGNKFLASRTGGN